MEGASAVLTTLLGALALVLAAWLVQQSRRSARVRARLFADPVGEAREHADESDSPRGAGAPRHALDRWLVRAGHRGARAAQRFLLACVASCLVGGVFVFLLVASGIPDRASAAVAGLPVLGPGFGVLVGAAPWLVGLAVAAAPILLVRRDRERRVEAIETALPLVIELLATLAEAGFGFESAIAEVLSARRGRSALDEELRLYQLEVSTGERRSLALARLAERVDRPSMSALTSALIHGEETGSSIAGLLRPQARVIRQQRRERALARAEALPEKLVMPLLVGFLPGLLVWTLGPAFHQLFAMLDAAIG